MEPYINKVIFVDGHFLEDLAQTSVADFEAFADPGVDTKVISLPLPQAEIEELTQVIDASAVRPGAIVVKPAYTDQFVPVDGFTEELVLRKYGLFVQLCIALGARKVSISSIEEVGLEGHDDRSFSAGLEASAPVGSVDAGVKSKSSNLTEDFRKSILKLNTVARGGEPNLEAAGTMIREYGLHKDSLFTDMLNMCSVPTNRLERHELSLDFSKDVKKVFDSSIQAKMKVMGKLYQGRAEFDKAHKSLESNRAATKLSVVVEF